MSTEEIVQSVNVIGLPLHFIQLMCVIYLVLDTENVI